VATPEGAPGNPVGTRRKLTRGDVFRLILRTYWVSLPYLLIFVLALLVGTWIVTAVFE